MALEPDPPYNLMPVPERRWPYQIMKQRRAAQVHKHEAKRTSKHQEKLAVQGVRGDAGQRHVVGVSPSANFCDALVGGVDAEDLAHGRGVAEDEKRRGRGNRTDDKRRREGTGQPPVKKVLKV